MFSAKPDDIYELASCFLIDADVLTTKMSCIVRAPTLQVAKDVGSLLRRNNIKNTVNHAPLTGGYYVTVMYAHQ